MSDDSGAGLPARGLICVGMVLLRRRRRLCQLLSGGGGGDVRGIETDVHFGDLAGADNPSERMPMIVAPRPT